MISPETKETSALKNLTITYEDTRLTIKIKRQETSQKEKPELPKVKDVVIFSLPSKKSSPPKFGLVVVNEVVNEVNKTYFSGWLFEISLPPNQSFENFIAEIRSFSTTSLELINSYESGTLDISNLPDLIILGQFAGVDDKKELKKIIQRTKLKGLPEDISNTIIEKILESCFS